MGLDVDLLGICVMRGVNGKGKEGGEKRVGGLKRGSRVAVEKEDKGLRYATRSKQVLWKFLILFFF